MAGIDPFVPAPGVEVLEPAGGTSMPPAGDAAAPAPQGEVAPEVRIRNAAGDADREAARRALRNLEATEARLARSAQLDAEQARGKLVQEMLPVLDNLDRTIQAALAHGSSRSDAALLDGVRMVRQQLEGVLRGYGVERIDATGQPFDPSLHEAIGIAAVADPRRHGVVAHQAEPGYRFAGRLLRPAKVTVGKLVAPVAAAAPRSLWR
jgi:molecular chaperone GrpE (heat shock protein)